MNYLHCNCKIISRGQGRSAVGAAAYRSGETITNDYDGLTHDYTSKGGIVYSEIILPENAPQEYQNRAILWNEVERVEKGSKAQLAREYEIALPRELNHDELIQFVRGFTNDNFVNAGMCADFSIHDKGDGNPHAHIMVTMRPIDKDGQWEYKCEKVYLCKNAEEEERGFTSRELEAQEPGEWEKQLPYYKNGNVKTRPVYLTTTQAETSPKYNGYSRVKKKNDPKKSKEDRVNPKIVEWNSTEKLIQVRKDLETRINHEMEIRGLPDRVNHRSYAEQGKEQIPTEHLGVSAKHMERRGRKSGRGERNREIKKANEQIKAINYLQSQAKKELLYIREDMRWNSQHEQTAKIQAYIPQIETNGNLLRQVQSQLEKIREKAQSIKPSKASEGRTVEYDLRQIPYFDYHKGKLIADIADLQQQVERRLAILEEQRKEPAVKEKIQGRTSEPAQRQPASPAFDVSGTARQLAAYRANYIKAIMQTQSRASYQENPIYRQQAAQITDLTRRVQEQTASIKQLQEEKAALGLMKGKQKKALQGKIDNFIQLRQSNLDKLGALGVSDPARADEAIKEKNALAAAEQAKAKAARENVGAAERAEEAKAAFLSLARSITPEQRQEVAAEVASAEPETGEGQSRLEYYKAEVEARRQLDPALKLEQGHQREQSRARWSEPER